MPSFLLSEEKINSHVFFFIFFIGFYTMTDVILESRITRPDKMDKGAKLINEANELFWALQEKMQIHDGNLERMARGQILHTNAWEFVGQEVR